MKIIRLILVLIVTCLFIWALETQWKLGDKSLPPIGAFMNPFSGFWHNAESKTQSGKKNQEMLLGGLTGEVQVQYDEHRVPHIFADHLEDAVRVQGYVTARDRLWQMDITTRKAAGRLSEVLGERTFNVDRLSRRRGMKYAAENNLVGWKKDPETIKLLEAYTAGINAWVDGLKPADYPIEFKLLNYKPERWDLLKTAYVIESMAESLASTESDLSTTQALAEYGRAVFDSLYPSWNPKQQPIIPDTGQWKDIHPFIPPIGPSNVDLSALDPQNQALSWNGMPDSQDPDPYLKGSNNWAVAARKTKNGYPLLANDPHLNLTLPSIWYQVQIHTKQFNCAGVSLPGIPGVIIGFNADYAWGVTNVSHDVTDWYQIKWTDASRSKYQLDNEIREVKKTVEEIKIKGKASVLDTVRYTVFGPVMYDFDAKHPLRNCALRWVSHETPQENVVMGFLALNAGKTYADYRKGIQPFDCPAQNFVFASRSGDIGITVQGKFPLRAPEQGRFVLDGSRWQNTWQDYIPANEIPAMKNPGRGFAYSANQHSTPPEYPYYYLGNFDDFRGRRIFNRLINLEQATVDSMKNMQLDNFSLRAYDALNAMLPFIDPAQLDDEGRNVFSVLAEWDGHYDKELLAPTLFETWWDSCYLKIWDEITLANKNGRIIPYPEAWRTIDLIETDSLNRFFDILSTPQKEVAADIVKNTFLETVQYFQKNPSAKVNWGAHKGFIIRHLGQIDAFSRKDIVVGGSKNSPNAIDKSHGPSWRMIIELGKETKGIGVYPGGQSGNPGSPFYDDMVDVWAKGAYVDILLMKTPGDFSDKMIKSETYKSAK
jgi:penicillin amidase